MALNATQRDFLIGRLGVKPSRKALDISGKLTDWQLKGAVDDYVKAEGEILQQISELNGVAGAAPLVTTLERLVSDIQKSVKAAKRDGGTDVIKEGTKGIGKLGKLADTAIKNKAFYVELDTAEQALKALDNHPQREHIGDERRTSQAALLEARRLAGEGDFKTARVKLTEATDANTEGKRCATAYAEVMTVKANTARIVAAMNDQYSDEADWKAFADSLASEAAKAEPPARRYDEAKTGLQDIIDEMKDDLTEFFVTDEPDDLTILKARQGTLAGFSSDGTTLVDDDVTKAETLHQQVATLATAQKWGEAVIIADTELPNLLTAAVKAADRRIEYEGVRTTTMSDIDGLTTKKYLLGQIFSLKALVENADKLATRKAMRMEDGIKALRDVSATCKQLLEMAKDSEAYMNARKDAEDQLKLLKEMPAAEAGGLAPQIEAIDKLMEQSRAATGIIDVAASIVSGPNMEDHHAHQVDWKGAAALMKQAVTDIAAAAKLAGGLGEATTALGAAQEADTAEKIEKAAETIRKQAEEASKKPFADKATHEFAQITGSLDEALREAKAGRLEIASTLLDGAGQMLIAAITIQTEQARFEETRTALELRLTALTTSTEPKAATLKGRTDPIPAIIAKAGEQANAQDWGKAHDGLRAATAAVTETEELAALRKTFDAEAKRIGVTEAGTDVTLEGKITKTIEQATAKADAFEFAPAMRLLANADAQRAGATVKSKAAAGLTDPTFLAALDKMMAAVGGSENFARATDNPSGDRAIPNGPELLDELVKNLPENTKMSVIEAIAKKRFGIELKVSALRRTGGKDKDTLEGNTNEIETGKRLGTSKRIQSAKKLYETLALTPEQAKDNPSLKKVIRENVLDDDGDIAGGGYYQSSNNLSSLSGRPGETMEDFGADATGYKRGPDGKVLKDKAGKSIREPQLPPIDPQFQPANDDKIDSFDFASVHETGHAVDDRMGFMAARENQPAFGGWIVHGGKIDEIAKKVAAKFGGDKADALEQYVTDKMIGASPDVPAVEPDRQVAINTACKAIDDWHGYATKCKPWWNQGTSEAITLDDGRVYQEAYSRNWVSYPLSERTKGITGYQFRAPGEWFAELYAAYHVGKLKEGHPARRWLSSLSL